MSNFQFGYIKGIFSYSNIATIILSIITSIFVFYYIMYNDSLSELSWVAIVSIILTMFSKAFLNNYSSFLNGFGKIIISQISLLLCIPLGLTLYISYVLIFFDVDLKLNNVIIVQAIISSIVFISVLFYLKKLIKSEQGVKYDIRKWNVSIRYFFFFNFITILNNEIGTLVLGAFAEPRDISYLRVSLQIGSLVGIVISSINVILGPAISSTYKKGNSTETQSLIKRSTRINVLCSLFIIVFIVIFRREILYKLFGEEYLPVLDLLPYTLFSALVNSLAGSVALISNMTGNEKKTAYNLGISLLLNVIILVLLVPGYGALGATIAASSSTICWNILISKDIYKNSKLISWLH